MSDEQIQPPTPAILVQRCQVGMGVLNATESTPALAQLDVFNEMVLSRVQMTVEGLGQLIENLTKIKAAMTGEALVTPARGLVDVNGRKITGL